MRLYKSKTALLILSLGLLFIAEGCTSETRLLNKIPINSVDVKVVDQDNNPISGAQVEASNGRQSTTDDEGIAKIRFGSVGIHSVSVFADNYMPSNFVVTLPTDRGKTITRRLTNEVSFSGISFGSMNMYPLIFNYMFSSYGYSTEIDDYQEGESTTWQITTEDGEEAMEMYKAFLKKKENGQEWWGIKLKTSDEDESSYMAEILFSKNQSSVLRYREKMGDGEIQEKPVSEGWYNQPVSLTEESMQGATTEKGVSVEVPKGTFTANLLEYGAGPETYIKIWQATDSDVPGGVIKYETSSDDEVIYSSQLKDWATDATTQLESY
ncbi:MAG: Ig-like domain-containing protein [Balneolaceae bacterium]|nr:Ig-like domain-containing protein [Balneolaceae bacterium]